MPSIDDLYGALGLEPDATLAQIKAAHRKLSKQHHPDTTGEAESETFRLIQLAYEVLSDEARRKVYDESGIVEGDDPAAAAQRALHDQAMFVLNTVLGEHEHPDQVDLVAAMVKTVDTALERSKISMAQNRNQAKRLDGVMRRLRRKSKKPNVLAAMLGKKIAGLDAELAKMVTSADDLRKVRVFIVDHEFDRAPTSWMPTPSLYLNTGSYRG